MISYFLKRKGFWSGKVLSRSIFFNFFLKPIVLLDVRFLEKSQYWPEDRVKEIQWERTIRILKIAYQNIPFWHAHFQNSGINPDDMKSWTDFEKIPIIKKSDLRGKSDIFNNKIPADWAYKNSTSGSTGIPFKFFIDRSFIMRNLALSQRMYDMFSPKRDYNFIRFGISDRECFGFGNYFFKVLDYNFDQRVDDLCRLYNGKNLIIYSSPSFLTRLAGYISNHGRSLNFKLAVASQEELSEIQRSFIQDKLKCPASRAYLTRELGWVAQECPQKNFHINSESCYVEIVDENGNSKPAGQEGRIVVTNFDNKTTPFIRYDTEDLGKIVPEECPCGRTLPILNFVGRSAGLLYLPDNKVLHHFNLVCSFHERADFIKKFQIIQEDLDKVTVKIVLEKPLPLEHSLTLREELASILGDNIKLAFEFVADIPSGPRGKSTTFVSKINLKND